MHGIRTAKMKEDIKKIGAGETVEDQLIPTSSYFCFNNYMGSNNTLFHYLIVIRGGGGVNLGAD